MIALLEMPWTRRLTPLVLAFLVAAVTFELIRRRKLLEEYALFWMITSLMLLVIAIFPEVVIYMADVLETNYLTIVILLWFTLISLVMLHFAVIASRFSGELRQLTQRLGLLELEVRKSQASPPAERAGEEAAPATPVNADEPETQTDAPAPADTPSVPPES